MSRARRLLAALAAALVAVACLNGPVATGADFTDAGAAQSSLTAVPGQTFTTVASTNAASCAVTATGRIACWGQNDNQSFSGTIPFYDTARAVDLTMAGNQATAFSSNSDTACTVSAGWVYCWGTMPNASTPTPIAQGEIPASTRLLSVAVGSVSTCAVSTTGKVYCWGTNTKGQLGNGTTTTSTTPVAVDLTNVPGGAVSSVAVGNTHACAVGATDRWVYCWGDDYYGQLGIASYSDTRLTPTPVSDAGELAPGTQIAQVSTGFNATCVVDTQGMAYCWGYNYDGGLGDGTYYDQYKPVLVKQGAIPAGVKIAAVTAAWRSACAVADDGKVYCWGNNGSGQLGNGSSTWTTTPGAVAAGQVPGGVRLTSVGSNPSGSTYCATADDANVYCWGVGTNYQLGTGANTSSNAPVLAVRGERPAGVGMAQINTGGTASCGLASNARVYCWGMNNAAGILGDGHLVDLLSRSALTIVPLPGGVPAKSVDLSAGTICAVDTAGVASCWGSNGSSRLGRTMPANTGIPAPVDRGAMPAGVTFQSVSVGQVSVCGLGSNGKAYCWGANTNGQLGNGTATTAPAPVEVLPGAVPGGVKFTSVAMGWFVGCALGDNGKAYCWGYNGQGQLGDGTLVTKNTPVEVQPGAVPAGVKLVGLDVSDSTACAVGDDGKAYCWGVGTSGQLGNGGVTNQSLPVAVSPGAVPGGVQLKSVALAASSTCAVGSDAKAYCWGLNSSRQLGDGQTTQANVPVANATAGPVKSMAVGSNSSSALLTNGEIWSVGANSVGYLGDGTTTARTTPVRTLPPW